MGNGEENKIDLMVAILSDMLPDVHVEKLVNAVLITGSVEAAYDFIVDNEQTEAIMSNIDGALIEELECLFPSVEKKYLANICSAFENASIEELIDTIIVQLTARKKSSLAQSSPSPGSKHQLVTDATFSKMVRSKSCLAQSALGFRTGKSIKHGGFMYDFGVDDPSSVRMEDYNLYREEAQKLIESQNQYFRRAASKYHQGGLTGSGHAAYLSEEGRKLSKEIDKYNAMAALCIFRQNNPNISTLRTIDLHGLTVKEAEPLIQSYLQHHFVDGDSNSVQIVTGYGRRSKRGARLKPAVFNLLTTSNYSFAFDNFAVFTVFRGT